MSLSPLSQSPPGVPASAAIEPFGSRLPSEAAATGSVPPLDLESPGSGVALVAWPQESARRADLAAAGQSRVLLVEPHAAPPITWDDLEDWVRLPVDRRELDARRQALARRAGVGQPLLELDGDGILRTGDAWVAIPPVEARILAALLHRRGEVVSRGSLVAAGWPNRTDDGRILDSRIKLLRRRLARVGARIHTVRGVGFLLDPLDRSAAV